MGGIFLGPIFFLKKLESFLEDIIWGKLLKMKGEGVCVCVCVCVFFLTVLFISGMFPGVFVRTKRVKKLLSFNEFYV